MAKKSVSDAWEKNANNNNIINLMVRAAFGLFWIILTLGGFSSYGPAFLLPWILISFILFMVTGFTLFVLLNYFEKANIKSLPSEEREKYTAARKAMDDFELETMSKFSTLNKYGAININLVCPHCKYKGKIRSKLSEEITTTKLVPIIGNNIKTRKSATRMHCENCATTWTV